MVQSDSHTSISGSDPSDDSGSHPLDAALRRRAAAGTAAAAAKSRPLSPSRATKSSSPESGEVLGDAQDVKQMDNSLQGPQQHQHVAGKKRQRVDSSMRRSSDCFAPLESSSSDRDLDADLACASENSSDEDISRDGVSNADVVEPAIHAAPPAGVILVEEAEERNAELQRLLRAPRCAA